MTRIYVGVLFALMLLGRAAPAKAAFTLSYATDYHTIAPGQTDLMSINCPSGTVVASGGWNIAPDQGQALNVWVSRQIGNGWRIMTKNTHATAYLSVAGYALCASGVAGMSSYSTVFSPINVPSFNPGTGLGYCPSGGIPTGGGFDSNYPNPQDLIVTASYPAYQNQWFDSEYNSTSSGKSYSLLITCTKGLSAYVRQQWGTQIGFTKGSSALASVDCNAGEYAIGGGFLTAVGTADPGYAIQRVRVSGNFPTTSNVRRWNARAYNNNQFDWAYLTPVAQCLHFL
jgi:hypothetical protein